MARITLQNIADDVGLSKFAVSRALAGKGGVSPATRAAVEAAATRLGYDRTPVTTQHNEIQLIFHDHDPVNSELAMQIQSGVQYEAANSGVPLRMGWTHEPAQVTKLALESAGVILFGPHAPEALEAVRQTGRPLVRVGWLDPLEQIDQVMGADHEAGAAVGHYLLKLGHRHIAYVHGAPGFRGRMERLYGLREVFAQQPDAVVHELKFMESRDFVASFATLRDSGAEISAFFCAHDGLAVTVVSELLGLGYKIPEDATVIGYGDFTAARQITPQLTTVRLPGRDMGIAALRLLLDRLRFGPRNIESAQRLFMVPTLIERASSAPARPRN
ncbi:MAG TPA: LacI family DNA-binding transcriptional regulator [Devosiaceae bacterium]|jgi:LacI family transcriptional regulator